MMHSRTKAPMKAWIPAAAVLILLVTVICLAAGAYVVEEGQQAVVTQFGDPVRYVSDAGLKFKIPFAQEVHLLEKRLLPWDGAPASMQTRDKKQIFIDVWGRWKIVNLETFYLALRTEQAGQEILDGLVESAVRDVVALNNLIDVVRSSDDELIYESDELTDSTDASDKELIEPDILEEDAPEEDTKAQEVADVPEKGSQGRVKLEEDILAVVDTMLMENYGIELSEVHIKRVNYVDSVKDTVYERMRSERLRVAMRFKSEAIKEQNVILGETRFELDEIEGEMEQKSAVIRGDADAQVIQLTADAYGKSPEALEFYKFLRRLEVFENSLDRNSRVILSTDSDIFRLFEGAGIEP